jgi:hypothetical protein
MDSNNKLSHIDWDENDGRSKDLEGSFIDLILTIKRTRRRQRQLPPPKPPCKRFSGGGGRLQFCLINLMPPAGEGLPGLLFFALGATVLGTRNFGTRIGTRNLRTRNSGHALRAFDIALPITHSTNPGNN